MPVLLSVQVERAPLVVGVGLAFVGGLLSFLSPCVLPLVPGYLGHLAGTAVGTEQAPSRRALLANGVAFVLGFAAVFTTVGIAIGQFLANVQAAQGYVRWVGGIVVILMGLHMTGLIQIPLLNRTVKMRPHLAPPRRPQNRVGIIANPRPAVVALPMLGRSFLVGIFFAAGWSPCVGPILTGIYGVVGAQPANGGILLFAYSLGLGVPFLGVALLFGQASGVLRRINRHYRLVSLVSGLFLIGIGILLFTDTLSRLARYAPAITLPGVS